MPKTTLTRDELLILLIEEAGEVIQAATKCLRFGFTRDEPGYGKNDEVLSQEIGDLWGIAEALPLDETLICVRKNRKLARSTEMKEKYGRKD